MGVPLVPGVQLEAISSNIKSKPAIACNRVILPGGFSSRAWSVRG
jgi:hypothetical protein